MGADLLEVHVHDGSRLHGVSVQELRLPQPAHVSLVVRPDGRGRAHADDDPAPRRLPARGDHARGARAGGPAAAGGQRGRPAGPLGRRRRRRPRAAGRGAGPAPDRAAVRAAAREAVRGAGGRGAAAPVAGGEARRPEPSLRWARSGGP